MASLRKIALASLAATALAAFAPSSAYANMVDGNGNQRSHKTRSYQTAMASPSYRSTFQAPIQLASIAEFAQAPSVKSDKVGPPIQVAPTNYSPGKSSGKTVVPAPVIIAPDASPSPVAPQPQPPVQVAPVQSPAPSIQPAAPVQQQAPVAPVEQAPAKSAPVVEPVVPVQTQAPQVPTQPAGPSIDYKRLEDVLSTDEYKNSVNDLFKYGFDMDAKARKAYVRNVLGDKDYSGCAEQNSNLYKALSKGIRHFAKTGEQKSIAELYAFGRSDAQEPVAVEQAKPAPSPVYQKPAPAPRKAKKQEVKPVIKADSADAELEQRLYNNSSDDTPADDAPPVRPAQKSKSTSSLDLEGLEADVNESENDAVRPAAPSYQPPATHSYDRLSRARQAMANIKARREARHARDETYRSESTRQPSLDFEGLEADVGSHRYGSRRHGHSNGSGERRVYTQSKDSYAEQFKKHEFKNFIRAIERVPSRAYSHQIRRLSGDIVDALNASMIKNNPYKILPNGNPDYLNSQFSEAIKDMLARYTFEGGQASMSNDTFVYQRARDFLNDAYDHGRSGRLHNQMQKEFGHGWRPITDAVPTEHSIRQMYEGFYSIQQATFHDFTKSRNKRLLKGFLLGFIPTFF